MPLRQLEIKLQTLTLLSDEGTLSAISPGCFVPMGSTT